MNSIFIDNDTLNELIGEPLSDKSSEALTGTSVKLIDFINRIEGWKTKCKNLHWASRKKNIHEYLDDFLKVLSNYQDGLAEEEMGIYGRMLPNVITGMACLASTPKEFIREVRDLTIVFYEGLPEDSLHAGIRSECETFIHDINKYVYLFSLADQEFKG